MATCTTCGAGISAAARFCSACGAPVAAAPEREVRKTVTLLFCDVSGSTALGERLDPEVLRRALRRYFEEIEAVIVSHGGLVEKFVGDAVMAVFGLPSAHEDDALRAVRAAVEVRERLPAVAVETGVELVFRTGLNTGEVVTGEGQTLATGDAVNVAARLQQAAPPGEILLGAATEALVRGHVDAETLAPLAVHGREEPVSAFRLRGLAAEPPRRPTPAFVGRARELRLLRDAYERVAEARELHLFTLLGPAGIGKTRLAGEFVASLGDEPVVAAGRCLSYGPGITFWPLAEILEQLGEEGRETRRRVLEGSASSPEELAWSIRCFLERVAAERPLVLLVDDLHWAQPALLDLLDRTVELSRDAPILLLCLARPELLEQRPTWAGGKLNAATLLLDALPAAEARTLVDRLEGDLSDDERSRIVDVGCGNPLFLEELVAFRCETGSAESPPLIRALLQARLDRLPHDERVVIECAAVIGTVFEGEAVALLAPAALRPAVDAHLRTLTVKELVRPGREEGRFAFRHELICERAYASLPKGERARMHEAVAAWLDERGDELPERDALVGYHLEQAALARRELGAPDEALESRAAERLAGAAHAARRLTDLPGAADLWSRALAL
ncbi:MAG TPA: AAA family ATPase, partial [Gaiellaceae bacterium]